MENEHWNCTCCGLKIDLNNDWEQRNHSHWICHLREELGQLVGNNGVEIMEEFITEKINEAERVNFKIDISDLIQSSFQCLKEFEKMPIAHQLKDEDVCKPCNPLLVKVCTEILKGSEMLSQIVPKQELKKPIQSTTKVQQSSKNVCKKCEKEVTRKNIRVCHFSLAPIQKGFEDCEKLSCVFCSEECQDDYNDNQCPKMGLNLVIIEKDEKLREVDEPSQESLFAFCECGVCFNQFQVELPILLNTPQDVVPCTKCSSELVSVIVKPTLSEAQVKKMYINKAKKSIMIELINVEIEIHKAMSAEFREKKEYEKVNHLLKALADLQFLRNKVQNVQPPQQIEFDKEELRTIISLEDSYELMENGTDARTLEQARQTIDNMDKRLTALFLLYQAQKLYFAME